VTGAEPGGTNAGGRWHALGDARALRDAAVEAIAAAAARAVRERGRFDVVLAGGNTPREIYRALAVAHTEWTAWHVYFGDERCLPADDAARNSRMATDTLLDAVPVPRSHIHVIPAELGAVRAARRYADAVRGLGDFDLVLLGLGEDGHTASLFPGHDWGTSPGSPDTLAVLDAPRPPPERVSLSAARLSRARQVIFLIEGESKHQAVARWRAGEGIPARAIRPDTGVDVLVESRLLAPGGDTPEP